MVKSLETGLPPYLYQQLCLYAHTRAFHSSAFKLLQVPHTNLWFGSCSFHVTAPTLWNSLAHSVHFYESLTSFQKHLRTFYLIHATLGFNRKATALSMASKLNGSRLLIASNFNRCIRSLHLSPIMIPNTMSSIFHHYTK